MGLPQPCPGLGTLLETSQQRLDHWGNHRDPSLSSQNKVPWREVTDHRWDKTEPVILTVMFTFTGTVYGKFH